MPHTQESQSIVETSSTLIETLMRHGKPFDLVGEDLVAIAAQHADVELVKDLRIGIDGEVASLRVQSQAKRGLRPRRSVGPSRLVCGVEGRLLGGRRQSTLGEKKTGSGERAAGGAGNRPGCSGREHRGHGVYAEEKREAAGGEERRRGRITSPGLLGGIEDGWIWEDFGDAR